jgi:cytosine/adenosine deaminase-related metal-dependent hydrolase
VKGQSTHQIHKTFWCPSNNLCTILWCGRSSQQYLEEWQQSRKIPKQAQFNPNRYWEEQNEILQGLDLDSGTTHIFTLSTVPDMHDQWGLLCSL